MWLAVIDIVLAHAVPSRFEIWAFAKSKVQGHRQIFKIEQIVQVPSTIGYRCLLGTADLMHMSRILRSALAHRPKSHRA